MADIALIQRFLPGTSRGGVGHFTDGLARALTDRGHAVTVFSQDPAPADAPYRVVQVPVRPGRLAPLLFPWRLRRLDLSRFDLVHAQGDDQWLPRRGRPPLVRTMHGTALAEAWHNGVLGRSFVRTVMHLWFFACEWMAAMRADVLVGVSADTLRYYPRDGRVIPNGIDVRALAPEAAMKKSVRPTVLFIGEVDSRKRGRLLIAAMAAVRREIPDAELWLVGPPIDPPPGCRVWGTVDAGMLRCLLQQAWVMCLPSAYEGFGRPYIEAMAAGTAVVATPNPGARAVIEHGTSGLLTSDADLAATLIRLLQSAEERAHCIRGGTAAAARYDWPVVVQEYEAVYREVMTRARA